MSGLNVLSVFDGMSGGQQSLKEVDIKVSKYYASEIKPNSINVTQYNFPQTIQLGNILNWKDWDITWSEIDLFIGGSPCQGFSIAGKKLNFEDERSKLFFVYLEILNYIKQANPNVKFLLENVKMPDEIADQIDELMGAKRQFLNSRHFTGMIRKRYYWSNIPILPYEEKDINIEDLIEDIPFDRSLDYFLSKTVYAPKTSGDGIITINPKDNNGKQTWQRGRVYDVKGKCPTICASLFDLNITRDHKTYRKLTQTECETVQGFPKGYTSIVTRLQSGEMLGDGWNVKTIAHIFKGLKG